MRCDNLEADLVRFEPVRLLEPISHPRRTAAFEPEGELCAGVKETRPESRYHRNASRVRVALPVQVDSYGLKS